MTSYLLFQLQAPMVSWGGAAVGEDRNSADYPGESALAGLLAAALGIRRDDEAALLALVEHYRYAVYMFKSGTLLRDYHTAQVPGRVELKGRPHRTRKDELALPRNDLHTILSTRDYRHNDPIYHVAVQAQETAPRTLEALAQALCTPKFTLYAGRKACPLARPLYPQILYEESLVAAFRAYSGKLTDLYARNALQDTLPDDSRLIWSDGMTAGVEPHLHTIRQDHLTSRKRWQYRNRSEHHHIFPATEED